MNDMAQAWWNSLTDGERSVWLLRTATPETAWIIHQARTRNMHKPEFPEHVLKQFDRPDE